MSTGQDYKILEELRRKMMDSNMDYIEEHRLEVLQSKVESHKKYGVQMLIIVQVGGEDEERI